MFQVRYSYSCYILRNCFVFNSALQVAELKKINHLLSETELHARRVIKVPSKGILVDLTEDSARPRLPRQTEPGSSVSVEFISEESVDSDQDNNTQVYLNNVDSVIKEIKEKAEIAAAKSPILNGSDSPLLSRKGTKSHIYKYLMAA